MNFIGYVWGSVTVTVERKLTQSEFEEIGLILKQKLGRYKSYADKYTFSCEVGPIFNTLLVYLRKIKAPHEFEITYCWDERA